jgi:large subunit ribosomal protein L24
MHIRVDDIVEVISGADRGRGGNRTRGKVLKVMREDGRLVVEGVNRVYRHVKRSQKNPQGGRLSKEMPIQLSNVMLVCTACGKAARTGARFLDDGSKVRYCKKCNAAIGQLAPARVAYAKDKSKPAEKKPAKK